MNSPVASRVLTILMPAWNEQDGIRRAVAAALEAAGDLVVGNEVSAVEVLIVDDGSTDDTALILDELQRDDDRVRFVRHSDNRGLGAALRTGFGEANGSLILYTDADLPFDLAEIGKALRLQRHYDADIVAAYRHDRTGEGLRRVAYSYLYNSLVRAVFGLTVRDVNFAAKLMRADLFDRITLRSDGSFIDVELLARADRDGSRIINSVSTTSRGPVGCRPCRRVR